MPEIKSNSDLFGHITTIEGLQGIPITGCMGDQHASLVGHKCFKVGEAKNTYGTGMFLLTNIGNELQFSNKGILTTMAYQFGKDSKPCYAMEGSIAVGGQAVTWLKDNLRESSNSIKKLKTSTLLVEFYALTHGFSEMSFNLTFLSYFLV